MNEQIVKKIQRLIALSDEAHNDNEHERATALRQANALMDRHGVEIADLDGDELGPRGKSGLHTGAAVWQTIAVAGIAKLYGCKVYRTTGREGEVFVVGRQHYRNIVLDLGRYVIASIDREAKRHSRRGRRFTGAFRKGAATGVQATAGQIIAARAQGETITSSSHALVLVEHYARELELNQVWLDDQDLNLQTTKTRATDAQGYAAGQAFGAGIGLTDQVEGSQPSGPALIGHDSSKPTK